ncbi:MAG: acyltransferase family protein [Actinomycetota bacterium]|nr:acyltransferase family protein [Actinomycetota bacterium]
MAPARSPGDGNRRRDIQGLRAVAVLLVVLFHAGLPLPGGFIGVDVFFVISGFVITAMLMRQWASTGRISFGQFYLRRFLRLTPALALTVAVVALASILLQSPFGPQQTTARTGIGAMLLAANGVIAHASGDYFAIAATTNPLLHTWSLSVEEQFYLAFPALLFVGWLLARRTGRGLLPPVLIVSAIAAGSFAASIAYSYTELSGQVVDFFGGSQTFAFYSPVTRAWEFAAGALLALSLARIGPLTRAASALLGLAGAGVLVASALLITEALPFPGVVALAPVTGTVLLILAGTHHTTGVNAALSVRPMVGLGDLSYSWYLWHWPVIVFAALLFPNSPTALIAAAAGSFAPAVASYLLLEQPMRRLRPKTRSRTFAIVITTVGIPIVTCGVLLAGANAGWGLTAPGEGSQTSPVSTASGQDLPEGSADLSVADGEVAGGEGGSLRSQHLAVRAGCVNTPLRPRTCTFGPADPVGTIVVAGDSQAYAVADGVVDAATALGYDTLVTSHTGCPFLGRESSGVHNYPCRSWQKSIVAYALANRPAAVVIANLSAGYVHPEQGWRTAMDDGGGRADSVEEATDLWRRGLEPVVSALREAGIGVVIMTSGPRMPGYTDRTSLLGSVVGSSDFTVSREEQEADRQPALAVEKAVAKAFPGTVVHDPNPSLCDDTTCWATRDGQVLYQDETHVSVTGSLLLSKRLQADLAKAIASR